MGDRPRGYAPLLSGSINNRL